MNETDARRRNFADESAILSLEVYTLVVRKDKGMSFQQSGGRPAIAKLGLLRKCRRTILLRTP